MQMFRQNNYRFHRKRIMVLSIRKGLTQQIDMTHQQIIATPLR